MQTCSFKGFQCIYLSDWWRGKENKSLFRTMFRGISRNVCCKSALIRKVRRVCARLNKLFAAPRDLSCWGGNHDSVYSWKCMKKFARWLNRWFKPILSVAAHMYIQIFWNIPYPKCRVFYLECNVQWLICWNQFFVEHEFLSRGEVITQRKLRFFNKYAEKLLEILIIKRRYQEESFRFFIVE